VCHVDTHAAAVGDDVAQRADGAVHPSDVVPLAPVVEPAVPELGDDERLVRPPPCQELAGVVGFGAQGDGGQGPGQGAAVQHQLGRPVRGEQQLADAAGGQGVA
jgi:hypothetical protein